MNITNNAELNTTCDEILTALAGVSAETLRTSASQRDSVHTATQAVLDKLGGF